MAARATADAPDVAEDIELAESVSIAMLTVLETLTPTERAVFVLREVFDLPFDEIAAATGKTAAAVRQIAHRARSHVAARQPRVAVDRTEQRRAVAGFLAALRTGDREEDLLGGLARIAPTAVIEAVLLNGAPGARVLLNGTVDTVLGFAFDNGRISRVFAMRNPDKLRRLSEETPLSR